MRNQEAPFCNRQLYTVVPSDQMLAPQDFFIYVPTTQLVSAHVQVPSTEMEETQSLSSRVRLDQAIESWVKIALGSKVVVYARFWDEELKDRVAIEESMLF